MPFAHIELLFQKDKQVQNTSFSFFNIVRSSRDSLWVLLNYTLKSYYNSFGSQEFYFLLSSITEQSLNMSYWETIREKDKERPAVNISKKNLLPPLAKKSDVESYILVLNTSLLRCNIRDRTKIENRESSFSFFFSIPVSTVSFVSTSLKS